MTEEDELERIMDDFDLATEEGDSSETQKRRLETLHQEGELTDEEFELLKIELLEPSDSPSKSSTTSDNLERDPVDWLPEKTINEIVGVYRRGLETPDPYSDEPSYDVIHFEFAALPSDAYIGIACAGSGRAPTAVVTFTERDQEERFREYVAQNTPYEIEMDMSDSRPPQIGVKFNIIPTGYDGDFSNKDIIIEINHLLQTIATTYEISMEELSAGSITVEGE